MTRSISKVLFLLTFAFGSTSFGQGRVDSDPILHNIWWTTYKIDNDINLTCTINSINNQSDLANIIAYYSKGDSIYKIVELMTIPEGTKMTSSYFVVNKPIFISVVKNNYRLTADKKQFFKAVTSFNDIVDTNYIQHEQLYKNFYESKYFFYQDTVRYANVVTGDKIRVDDKKDKDRGLKLYYNWQRVVVTKQ